jgi:hypothetical protein
MDAEQQTYFYAGRIWKHDDVMNLKDRRLRYRILNHDKVKSKHAKDYRLNREKLIKQNNDNERLRKAAAQLRSIEIF